jgi:SAM-dependent methyltransferase
MKKEEIDSVLGKYDPSYPDNGAKIIESIFTKPALFSEGLFEYFGAEKVDSVDYSDYEGATIIHDMNTPIDNHLKNKYDVVWDGGCLEHIFDFPVAIKNCMDMVKPKGHLILETPANNFFGHGFYQFSPELFFSLLDKHNSFTNTKIFMQGNHNNWYEVISPKVIKKRHVLCPTSKESLMFIISEKTADVPEVITAFQSDYVDVWNDSVMQQPAKPTPNPLSKGINPPPLTLF